MPVTYCEDCDKCVDLDKDVEHFQMHKSDENNEARWDALLKGEDEQ